MASSREGERGWLELDKGAGLMLIDGRGLGLGTL